ncbi:hypothetical protein [Actinoplanes sp. NPDC049265]|uniref:hypothetical protein n=1 Tax=Actinoplanes sp. NPDC049265 TaxID=3363902 RepID=UPI0037124803
MFVVVALAGTLGVRLILMNAIHRPRPVEQLTPAGEYAFPSGHTTASAAAALKAGHGVLGDAGRDEDQQERCPGEELAQVDAGDRPVDPHPSATAESVPAIVPARGATVWAAACAAAKTSSTISTGLAAVGAHPSRRPRPGVVACKQG